MTLKKIKLPECIQGCHKLRVLFKMEVYESTICPTHIRMTECYIYCDEKDTEIIRRIIQELKRKDRERN